ncbi:coiled-coil domain-containing protein 24 isoform X2 [Notothenia coriiceps]|uniref:Coiled-coil domain-containing protein 24 isoform X2 n=1 Tax=Notothenia coriiceps TaxID=8208 RepID=A0A6I9NA38_9TELE|nr:PREDICTED: coiled-coil domain-containing protein 24 isoform X2 [Notothenia coriiceps]
MFTLDSFARFKIGLPFLCSLLMETSFGQSLWSLITEHVPGSELCKIHTALGYSVVDMYIEVHTEAEMQYKMWQGKRRGINGSRNGTPLPLADPPAVKELFFGCCCYRNGEELLSRYKPQTVDYALSHLDSRYTNPGEADYVARPSSRCSVRSDAEDEVEAMRDKLNVTDIDQVVDRLKSVLMEECEALKRLVKHFRGNITQKCPTEHDNSEPTLAELRELRGAIQSDLELYPSWLSASQPASPLPLKKLKNKFSLPSRVSIEGVQDLSPTTALKPHPPPLSHTTPRPPSGARPSKTSSSVKVINSSSLTRTHGQHIITSAFTGARKTQTSICSRISTSRHANLPTSLPGSTRDQMVLKTLQDCSLYPEQNGASPHCRTLTSSPSFPRNSSNANIHRPSRKSDLSPQTERKSSPALRSRNLNSVPSFHQCEAGSYSSNTEHCVSTTGKPKTKKGQQNSTCGGSLLSVQMEDDIKKFSSESFQSETGSSPTQMDTMNRNNGIDINTNGHLAKDITQQQNPLATSVHPAAVRKLRQFFPAPKIPLEGDTSQSQRVQETQTELEFIHKFTVPPKSIST